MGGGGDPQFRQPPPPPPPPPVQPLPPEAVGETSRQLFQSRLEFDPQLAQQRTDIFAEQGPQLQQLIFGLFPELGTLQQQVQQQLSSPSGLTPEQQAAQEGFRQRGREATQRQIQLSANLGGGLFGGRRELREERALGELEQGFVRQDIDRQMQQRQQTLGELRTLAQLAFPQVQQVPGVTPSPDTLIQALLQQQANFPIAGPVFA